jgi:hypothetical protein
MNRKQGKRARQFFEKKLAVFTDLSNIAWQMFLTTIGFITGIFVASFFEWTLHRFLMHRPFGKFDYPFRKHALVHHQTFRADHTYHLIREEDKGTIPMAWWNGPVLILVGQLPFLIVCLYLGNFWLLLGTTLASSLYYSAYEYIHWCMHLPKTRSIERSGIYFRLNGHHLLHHRYMHKNFNVVLPLADLLLGTLLLRSKVSFAQATGPAVPNVQPRMLPRDRAVEIATR